MPSSPLSASTVKLISASSSTIVNVTGVASPNVDLPPKVNVSGASTTSSSVIVKPANVPAVELLVERAGMDTVSAVDE